MCKLLTILFLVHHIRNTTDEGPPMDASHHVGGWLIVAALAFVVTRTPPTPNE